MELDEVAGSPGFWLLGAGGTIAVLMGYIMSKKMDMVAMPIWQVAIVILVIWAASAFFVMRGE